MAGRRRSRLFLASGLALLLAGVAALAWERQQATEADVELVALPMFLLGLFLIVEGYLAGRRDRLTAGRSR